MRHTVLALLAAIALLAVFLVGCANNTPPVSTGKIRVITTLFPQYDFVRQIAGDTVELSLILPPGMEPHSFEPSPRDIVSMQSADLFIFTTLSMEPWVSRLTSSVRSASLKVVEAGEGIELLEEEDDEDHHGHDHGPGGDPHIWLDPLNAIVMVENIARALAEIDPVNAEGYLSRATAYQQELLKLHGTIDQALAPLTNRTILYAGHFAFGYFAHRYGLQHLSPYTGFAPDAEPTPQRIAELIERVRESGTNTIFYAELVEPRVARVISEQTGAEMVLLHGVHNVSRDELASGVTYLELMTGNLDRLLKGMKMP